MKTKIRKCYISENGKNTTQKRCIVQQLPEKEETYGIMFINDKNRKEDEIKKGYKVSPFKFIFKKETRMTILFIVMAFLLTLFDALATTVSIVAFSVYLYLAKPYSSKRKTLRAHESFRILNIVTSLGFVILYMNTGQNDMGYELIKDVLIAGIFAHLLFVFLEKVHRYSEVFAIDIDAKENWKDATEYIWMGKK